MHHVDLGLVKIKKEWFTFSLISSQSEHACVCCMMIGVNT